MVMLVRQMASLVRQAEDMFAELEVEVKNVEMTSRKIQERVVRLQTTADNLDCLGEKVGMNVFLCHFATENFIFVDDLDSCRKIKNHFDIKYEEETNLFLPQTRPKSMLTVYRKIGEEDKIGKQNQPDDSPYLCIPIKRDVNCKYFNVETETKRVRVNLDFIYLLVKY